MQFFSQAVTVLQSLVIALGAGLCVWGGINLMETIFYKGIMPSEKVLDFPVDCNTLTGSVNL